MRAVFFYYCVGDKRIALYKVYLPKKIQINFIKRSKLVFRVLKETVVDLWPILSMEPTIIGIMQISRQNRAIQMFVNKIKTLFI